MYGLFRLSVGELEILAEQAYAMGSTATAYRLMFEIHCRLRRATA